MLSAQDTDESDDQNTRNKKERDVQPTPAASSASSATGGALSAKQDTVYYSELSQLLLISYVVKEILHTSA